MEKRQRCESYHVSDLSQPVHRPDLMPHASLTDGELPRLTSCASSPDNRRIEKWLDGGALQQEVHMFLEQRLLASTAIDESVPQSFVSPALVLNECMHTTANCLTFQGAPGDCYESVQCLNPVTVQLLQLFGKFEKTACGAYLSVGGGGAGSSTMGWVAALHCAVSTLLIASQPGRGVAHQHLQRVAVCMCGANGYGWYSGLNTVPALCEALRHRSTHDGGTTEPTVVVLWDDMLTDAGSPAVARVSKMLSCAAHHRYGVGITSLARYCAVVQCGQLSLECVVAQSVLLSHCGPLLVHCHFPFVAASVTDVHLQADVKRVAIWLARCVEAPLQVCLILSGNTALWDAVPLPVGFQRAERGMGGREACACVFTRGASWRVSWRDDAVVGPPTVPHCAQVDLPTTVRSPSPLEDSSVLVPIEELDRNRRVLTLSQFVYFQA